MAFPWLAVALLLAARSAAANSDAVEFDEHVAPVLERACLRCHGAETRKGRLDLSTRAAVLRGGRRGAAVVPGDPPGSLLLALVSGDAPRMPKDGEPLTAVEVDHLRRWIEAGLPWSEGRILAAPAAPASSRDWWSLQPLTAPAVPSADSAWPRTPVDAFVLRRLVAAGLTPSPEADRRTLVRRLTYDLHGLPPSPDEVRAFLGDPAPDAYERLVDRLLDSPRYGERWGRHWLDVVHFGETHGYDKDKPRLHAWPYRDHVIDSLNQDKPYARFVEEQLAGDVLFPDDPAAVVATGFIAAGPWDFVGHVELREGTVDKRITRSLDRDDMVMTALSTFASVTVHCARCHDHRFDPVSQEDYYGLQAVFAGVDRADRPYDPDPEVHRRRRELTEERSRLTRRSAELDAQLADVTGPEIQRLGQEIAAVQKRQAGQPGLVSPDAAPSGTLGYHSEIASDPVLSKWVQVDLGREVVLDRVVLLPAHVAYGGHPGPGFGFPARFRVDVSTSEDLSNGATVFDHTTRDFPHPGDDPVVIDGGGRTARFVRITATRLWERTEDWIFALSEVLVLDETGDVARGSTVTALDSIENFGWGRAHLTDGATSRWQLEAGDLASRLVHLEERRTLQRELEDLVRAQEKATVAAIPPALRSERDHVARRLELVEAALAGLPPSHLVYAAARDFKSEGAFTPPTDGPRPVHFLYRGNVRTPGEEVAPGGLACLPELAHHFELPDPGDEGARRVALARWLTDPRNPLTWRSLVNRVWQYHFGRGLVDTPNDFGRMGAQPTHPELLDWLAATFRDGGGSLKDLHRLLVTSAVYRQSSRGRPEAAGRDRGNRLLWRMNRRRLEAEAIRDTVLLASGRLDLTMGGPSDQQFDFIDDHSPRYDYQGFDVDGPGATRRSVYRFLVRSVPDPFFECLDGANPSLLTPTRSSTLTALQALALQNNPLLIRGATHLAARVEGERAKVGQQVERVWWLLLSRPPSPEETAALTDHVNEHGLASLCRLAFNLNEFQFVD